MKKVWNIVTTLILVLMIGIVAAMYVPGFFGIKPMVVLSGSMEPVYPVGSLLYVNEKHTTNIQVGNVITFYLDEKTLVTHRVVAVDQANKTYTTKGDANKVADASPVAFSNVLGEPVVDIPKLGFFADKLSSKSGKIIYITAIIFFVMLTWLGDLIWSEKKENEEEAAIIEQPDKIEKVEE
jgi:signal peptidase